MSGSNSHRGHKTTLICPVKGCKYHSRKFHFKIDPKNRLSNSSTKCPIHQLLLKDVGSSKYAVLVMQGNNIKKQ